MVVSRGYIITLLPIVFCDTLHIHLGKFNILYTLIMQSILITVVMDAYIIIIIMIFKMCIIL